MPKTCDICGGKAKFPSFRCQDGVVCKNCYLVVSNGYTSTIAKATLDELKRLYIKNTLPPNQTEHTQQS